MEPILVGYPGQMNTLYIQQDTAVEHQEEVRKGPKFVLRQAKSRSLLEEEVQPPQECAACEKGLTILVSIYHFRESGKK